MLTVNRLVAFVVAFAKPKYLRALTPIVGAFFASKKLMYSLAIFACPTLERYLLSFYLIRMNQWSKREGRKREGIFPMWDKQKLPRST